MRRLFTLLKMNRLPGSSNISDSEEIKAARREAIREVNQSVVGRVLLLVSGLIFAGLVYGSWLQKQDQTRWSWGFIISAASGWGGTLAILYLWRYYWCKHVRAAMDKRLIGKAVCPSCKLCLTGPILSPCPNCGTVIRYFPSFVDKSAAIVAGCLLVSLGIMGHWLAIHLDGSSGGRYDFVFGGFIFQSLFGFLMAALCIAVGLVVNAAIPAGANAQRFSELLIRAGVYLGFAAFAICAITVAFFCHVWNG